ncbi:helix-turn-helix domain-containing protein [Vibrio sp. NTOU-M3]|uniref:helix-turn-helix domain-containing protein n=1 Tax=Vibrio sp. NTOU-M3 TaxID=3234954 RepID=UPI00349F7297
MHRVAILSHRHVSLFELACAVELFALPRPEFNPWYQTDVVNLEDCAINSTGQICLNTQFVESLAPYDTLVIPSWPTERYPTPNRIREQVQHFARQNKRILSFCSGAFLLADLGLLNHRNATTHWMFEDKFRQRFPQVSYTANVLYVFDGKIGCSAGSASALDLGLAVIRHDFGYHVANQVAKRLVVSGHRNGGQAQFVDSPILEIPNQFSQALEWALSHLDQPISIDQLASQANMSRRTFDRKFRASFDLSAKEWLTLQRIEQAKGLLESAEQNMERLAQRTGFENAVTMRHHFRRVVGVSPTQYRQQFSK